MANKTAADLLVNTLEKAGVERVYGITGDSANYITYAISKSSIRFVHTRHEESAAFAAAAEAQATAKLAVCMGSCGPGSLHLINGLYEAHRNGVPVLSIVTEIHKSEIGTRFIQEIDTRAIFRGCSYFCEYVRSGDDLPRMLGIAMQTAISKKGVAIIIITAEVSSSTIEDSITPSFLPFYTNPDIHPSEEELKRIADQINKSDKVTIFGGAGCANARNKVFELSNKLNAPIVWTIRAKEYLEYKNPNPAGISGFLGTSSSDYALKNCDTLLLLGCGFAFKSLYPDNVNIIQIDINGENISRRHNVSIGVIGDINSTLTHLLPLLNNKDDIDFANECISRHNKSMLKLQEIASQDMDSNKAIFPEHLTAILNDKLASDAWIACDIGTPWAFSSRYILANEGRRFFCSSLHGTMAAAMPSTIGLTLANPDKQVVALCGDGGIAMLLGDLITMKQEDLKPKIFIYNNSSLDFVAQEMKADGLIPSYTDLKNPNFAKVAESIGIKGIRVEKVNELGYAIDDALSSDEAVIVDVVVDGLSMLVPPKITAKMAEKYSHYLFKMIHNGSSEEILKEILASLRLK